jgi:hypothetical protein
MALSSLPLELLLRVVYYIPPEDLLRAAIVLAPLRGSGRAGVSAKLSCKAKSRYFLESKETARCLQMHWEFECSPPHFFLANADDGTSRGSSLPKRGFRPQAKGGSRGMRATDKPCSRTDSTLPMPGGISAKVGRPQRLPSPSPGPHPAKEIPSRFILCIIVARSLHPFHVS